MVRADQHEVVQFGFAAVLPMPYVVCVQTPGRFTAGHRTGGVAVLECAAQPAVDQPGRSPGADGLPVAFEPHFTGGVAGQVSAVGVGEQRTQMKRCGLGLDIEVHHHGGVMAVGPADRSASQPASTSRMNASVVVGTGGR